MRTEGGMQLRQGSDTFILTVTIRAQVLPVLTDKKNLFFFFLISRLKNSLKVILWNYRGETGVPFNSFLPLPNHRGLHTSARAIHLSTGEVRDGAQRSLDCDDHLAQLFLQPCIYIPLLTPHLSIPSIYCRTFTLSLWQRAHPISQHEERMG